MSTLTYALGIVAPLVIFVTVLVLLRRGRMKERHSIWWLTASLLALLVGVFTSVLEALANFVGVQVPINLVFFGGIALLFLVNVQHAGELTRLEDRIRVLAERVALAELDARNRHSDSSET